MLNYNHLYYFHIAASAGSLAKAAERLGVTQPTVSEQIRQLEKKLGVRLFDRSTTGLRLTDHGRYAYEHTTPMFRAGERLAEALELKEPATKARPLRVGVSVTVTQRVSRDLLVPLFAAPGEAPSVRSGSDADLLRGLRAHDLDAVLCESEPTGIDGEGLRVTTIHHPRLAAIAAPDTAVRDDWSDAAVIEYPAGCAYHAAARDFLAAHALSPRSAGETDDATLMLEAVKRSRTVAFVPWSIARGPVDAGQVRALAILDDALPPIHAISHDGQIVLMAIERMIAYAQRELDRCPRAAGVGVSLDDGAAWVGSAHPDRARDGRAHVCQDRAPCG